MSPETQTHAGAGDPAGAEGALGAGAASPEKTLTVTDNRTGKTY